MARWSSRERLVASGEAHRRDLGSVLDFTDLLGGYVQLMFSGPGAARPHVRARKLKALAVTSRERAAGLEAIKQAGIRGE